MGFLALSSISSVQCMSEEEIIELREESKDMFYHAYNAYLFNAFPADELMPLTCQGKLSMSGGFSVKGVFSPPLSNLCATH